MATSPPAILVLGVGNLLLRDEGCLRGDQHHTQKGGAANIADSLFHLFILFFCHMRSYEVTPSVSHRL